MENNRLLVRVVYKGGLFGSKTLEVEKIYQPPAGHILLGTRLLKDVNDYLVLYVDTIDLVTDTVYRGTEFFRKEHIRFENLEDVYVIAEEKAVT